MTINSNNQGRAFEYITLITLKEEISKVRDVVIKEDSSFFATKRAWNQIDLTLQSDLKKASKAPIDIIFESEPMICEDSGDVLELLIQPDSQGEKGDVRDILLVRRDISWEVGLSLKHNHSAVKHSRLAKDLDFGEKWFGIPCSEQYWKDIGPIFKYLEEEKSKRSKWRDLPDKENDVYVPLLNAFKDELAEIDTKDNDEAIARKIRQLQERKERREKRKAEKAEKAANPAAPAPKKVSAAERPIEAGDTVRIKGLSSIGEVESIDGKMAVVIFGTMKTKMRADRLEHAELSKSQLSKQEERNNSIAGSYGMVSKDTRDVIDNRKLNFKQDIDVRGMRGDEAISAITYFIDDAILVGVSRVRILHGTGTGILRQLIRQYLATVPNVSHFRDEHVQFGGAGITVVDLE